MEGHAKGLEVFEQKFSTSGRHYRRNSWPHHYEKQQGSLNKHAGKKA